MRSEEERNKVKELHLKEMNQSEISRATGIPRKTVGDIVNNRFTKRTNSVKNFLPETLSLVQMESYSYLLGQYLGDGCIDLVPRGVWRLRIASDCKYPNIIGEIKSSMRLVLPKNKPISNVRKISGKSSCDFVTVYSKVLFEMFPQHGNGGKKHGRKIELLPWQEMIVQSFPKSFVRGLIHSDGCRFSSKKTGRYSYQFTNCSLDIINIYKKSLDLLGISYFTCERVPSKESRKTCYNVFSCKSKDVAFIDSFVGAKS